jgi:hypothetical protein
VSDEPAGGDGELLVSWERFMAPWVTYEVVVDSRAMSKLGYRQPALIPLPVGPHEVVLRHRKFKSRPVAIDIDAGGRVLLFGAVRQMPQGLRWPRQMYRWTKENGTWLGTHPAAPKPVSTFSLQRIVIAISGVVFFSLSAARDLDRGRTGWLVLAGLLVAGSLASVVREATLFWRAKRPSTR